MKARSFPENRRQHGLTLVELMIAMVLGLVLVAGAIQLLVSNKQSYRLQDSLSRLQENGRFAIQLLSDDIRMSGFHDPFTGPAPFAFFTASTPTGAAIADDLGSGLGDRLAVVRVYPDTVTTDCLGSTTANDRVVNVYWVTDSDNDGGGGSAAASSVGAPS